MFSLKITVPTRGFADIVDITREAQKAISDSEAKNGVVNIFVPGSTAGVTTIEYEDGVLEDLKNAFERLAPQNARYKHDSRWGDGNGFAHVRSALLGASIVVPFEDGLLLNGAWQQIVLVDFDNRPRRRDVIISVIAQ